MRNGIMFLTFIFLAIAAVAAAIGFGPAEGTTAMLAKAVFVASVFLFILALVAGAFRDALQSLTSTDDRRR